MQRQQKPKSWRYSLGEGIFYLGFSVFMFWYFTDFEKSGESSRQENWIIATLYNWGGKWLVSAVIAALGVGCLITAKRKWARR